MEQEDLIRVQMEDTRTSLTEKLETLEKQVAQPVLGAAQAVTEKVQAATATVKDTVEETISAVKEGVHKGVSAVRGVFDVPGHVDRHPWAMLAGSVALGYVAGAALGHRRASRVRTPRSVTEPEPLLAQANGRHPRAEGARSGGLLARFAPELSKLKNMALGALVHAVREKLVKAAAPEMGSSLTQFFDNISQKITGEPAPSTGETDWNRVASSPGAEDHGRPAFSGSCSASSGQKP